MEQLTAAAAHMRVQRMIEQLTDKLVAAMLVAIDKSSAAGHSTAASTVIATDDIPAHLRSVVYDNASTQLRTLGYATSIGEQLDKMTLHVSWAFPKTK